MAVIKDCDSNATYQFNDEEVEKLADSRFRLDKEEDTGYYYATWIFVKSPLIAVYINLGNYWYICASVLNKSFSS